MPFKQVATTAYNDTKNNYYDAGLTDKDIRNLRIVSAREAAEWKHSKKTNETPNCVSQIDKLSRQLQQNKLG